jgi:DNA-binding transcriptional regulator LsrR (DeoR family)
MYQLHTKKQLNYFDEVIRLHYEEGYGEDRISRLLPVSHSTVSRWITIFAKEKNKISVMKANRSLQSTKSVQEQGIDVQSLQKRVKELEAQLSRAEMKAKFYDKMIDIAEAKFKISIRKKSGAKQ